MKIKLNKTTEVNFKIFYYITYRQLFHFRLSNKFSYIFFSLNSAYDLFMVLILHGNSEHVAHS